MNFVKLIFTLLSIGILMSCEKENKDVISNASIAGYVQKGQFIKGSTISAYALNDKLIATGESFPSVIKDDLGSFAISAEVAAPYLELQAEGYYFVENTGETSTAPIYLNAIVNSLQKKVNINLLTTITSGRIKKLINDGQSFSSAKKQAEKEIMNIFSAYSKDVTIGFEEMNISEDGKSNAVLLAISCLIQEGRNAGEIQKLISDISSDLEADGDLSDKLLNDIFNKNRSVSIPDVVRNLITYYNNNGIDDFKIPPFYAILNKEYSSGFHIISLGDNLSTDGFDMDVQGGTKEYYAISYDNFVTESDVDWITAEITEVCTNLYKLTINVSPSTHVSGRTGHLYIKSKSGEILYTNTTNQRGNGQRIYIELKENSPRSKALTDEDKVNINGKNYNLLYDNLSNMYYVDLPKTDGGYGISNMPEMVVAGKNGDVLCATFTYNNEINEFISDDSENITTTRIKKDISVGAVQSSKIPYYAALKGISEHELPNPAFAKLETACALLTLQFKQDNSSIQNIEKIEIEINPDGFLAGEVTTCMYPDQSIFDPSYIVPETEYKNKSNKLTIHNINNDNKVSLLIHPQIIQYIKCTAYNTVGSQLFQIANNMNFELRKGTNANFTFTITE